jgi:hypothetical protein
MREVSVHKSRSSREAEEWDVAQQLSMTPEKRREAARELQSRFFGLQCPDVRASWAVRVLHPGAGGKPVERA